MSTKPKQRARIRLTAAGLTRAAIVSAQLLLVLLALWALWQLAQRLSVVLLPLVVALLLSALLEPMVSWLTQHRVPRSLAVTISFVVGTAFIGGLATFVAFAVMNNFDRLRQQVTESITRIQSWVATQTPFNVDGRVLDRVTRWLQQNQQAVLSQALGAFNTIGAVLVGLVIALVLLVMMLYDGPRIWDSLLRLWRPATRQPLDDAGRAAFRSVVVYVRVTALIALIDAIAIGIGLVIVGVPLALPLAAVVFLGGFVPYVGAFVSGILAIAVTLVSNGPVAALIVLGIVVGVQQLEGQVLQPVLTGNFVRMHPMLVLIALVIGGSEAGIAGVLLAVPFTTAVRSFVVAIAEHQQTDETGTQNDKGNAAEPPHTA